MFRNQTERNAYTLTTKNVNNDKFSITSNCWRNGISETCIDESEHRRKPSQLNMTNFLGMNLKCLQE